MCYNKKRYRKLESRITEHYGVLGVVAEVLIYLL